MREAYTYILMRVCVCVSSRDRVKRKRARGGGGNVVPPPDARFPPSPAGAFVLTLPGLPLPSFHPISSLFGFRVPAEMTRALFTRLLLLFLLYDLKPTGAASRIARPSALIESHSAHGIPLVNTTSHHLVQ